MLPPEVAKKIRRLELRIVVDPQCPKSYKAMQGWLEVVVSNLSAHQLRSLNIELGLFNRRGVPQGWVQQHVHRWQAQRRIPPRNEKNGEYCLEPLARLRGIGSVNVQSGATEVFAQKLAAVMMSQDETALPVKKYEEKVVLRKARGKMRRQWKTYSLKNWWDSTYDWGEQV